MTPDCRLAGIHAEARARAVPRLLVAHTANPRRKCVGHHRVRMGPHRPACGARRRLAIRTACPLKARRTECLPRCVAAHQCSRDRQVLVHTQVDRIPDRVLRRRDTLAVYHSKCGGRRRHTCSSNLRRKCAGSDAHGQSR